MAATSSIEVKRVMRFAARVERRRAHRADRPAFQILTDSQFRAAGPAQNRLLTELFAAPDASAVPSFRLMAINAGIISLAAVELDRHDIECASVMGAAGVRIYFGAPYRNSRDSNLQARRLPFTTPSSLAKRCLEAWRSRPLRWLI
jgi:hypothetical protein